jgi:hypothetical protein
MSHFGHSLVAILMYAPIVLGVVLTTFAVAVTGAPWLVVGVNLLVYLLGFLMLFQAKRSIRAADLNVSFGSRKMTPSNRLLYRLGYGLMLLGALFTYVLYSVTFAGIPAASAA